MRREKYRKGHEYCGPHEAKGGVQSGASPQGRCGSTPERGVLATLLCVTFYLSARGGGLGLQTDESKAVLTFKGPKAASPQGWSF